MPRAELLLARLQITSSVFFSIGPMKGFMFRRYMSMVCVLKIVICWFKNQSSGSSRRVWGHMPFHSIRTRSGRKRRPSS